MCNRLANRQHIVFNQYQSTMNLKIYLSSTAKDLRKYREQLRLLIDGVFFKGYDTSLIMERMSDDGRNEKSLETCLNEVASSDIYILILARNYGSLTTYQGEHLSYTHHEYNRALEMLSKRENFWLFKLVFDENHPEADPELKNYQDANQDLYAAFKTTVISGNQYRKFNDLTSFCDKFREILYEMTQTQLNALTALSATKSNFEMVRDKLPFCGRTEVKDSFQNIVDTLCFDSQSNYKNIFLQSFEIEHTDLLFQYINHYFKEKTIDGLQERAQIYCNFPAQINNRNVVMLVINDDSYSSASRFKASLGNYLYSIRNDASLERILVPIVLKVYSNQTELENILDFLKDDGLYNEINELTNKRLIFTKYYFYITIIYNEMGLDHDFVRNITTKLRSLRSMSQQQAIELNGIVKPLTVNEIDLWKTSYSDVAKILNKVSLTFYNQQLTMQDLINQLNH